MSLSDRLRTAEDTLRKINQMCSSCYDTVYPSKYAIQRVIDEYFEGTDDTQATEGSD